MKNVFLLVPCLLCSTIPTSKAAASSLTDIAQAHYQANWHDDPVNATLSGSHKGDARLPDLSSKALNAQIARLQAERKALSDLDMRQTSLRDQDDRDILRAQIGDQLLSLQKIQPYRHNPDIYVSQATDALYGLVARDYAPLQIRMQAAITRLQALPAFLAAASDRLDKVPSVFVEIADEDLEGGISFFEKDIPVAFAYVNDAHLQQALDQAIRKAVTALRNYRTAIHKIHPDGSFALGTKVLIDILAADMIDTPPETIAKTGERQLEKDRADFLALARSISPDRPLDALARIRRDHSSAQELISTANSQLRGLQNFVLTHHLVTLPSHTLPEVVATPAFEQSLFSAATDWPGPFEKAPLPTLYDITPPAPFFTPAQVQQALEDFNRPELLVTTVHEVMPGHFVQGLFRYANPQWSMIRKGADSYTTTEGWAHYAEQMMVEQGVEDRSPAVHLMQLQDALLRDCRLLAAFGMHAQGMTLSQATEMMEKRCFQSPVAAYKEARRGTADPGYFSYTLGKLMILKLRTDMQKTEGAAFSLQRFHNSILNAGLVPMRIIRRETIGEDGSLL